MAAGRLSSGKLRSSSRGRTRPLRAPAPRQSGSSGPRWRGCARRPPRSGRRNLGRFAPQRARGQLRAPCMCSGIVSMQQSTIRSAKLSEQVGSSADVGGLVVLLPLGVRGETQRSTARNKAVMPVLPPDALTSRLVVLRSKDFVLRDTGPSKVTSAEAVQRICVILVRRLLVASGRLGLIHRFKS